MSICIAAICDTATNSPKIVFCGDRLVPSSVQFEHGSPKIIPISKNVFIMLAGDPTQGSRIIQHVLKRIGDNQNLAVEEVAEIFSEEYALIENQIIELEILNPLGLTRQMIPDSLVGLPDWLQFTLYNQLSSHSIGVEFIVFGLDRTGAHIFTVADKGKISSFDQLGFVAIGSGSEQANVELTRFLYSPAVRLSEVLLKTYQSKKNSERVQGVGIHTDLGVMFYGESGPAYWVAPPEFMQDLDQNLAKIHKTERDQLVKLTTKINEIFTAKQNPVDKSP